MLAPAFSAERRTAGNAGEDPERQAKDLRLAADRIHKEYTAKRELERRQQQLLYTPPRRRELAAPVPGSDRSRTPAALPSSQSSPSPAKGGGRGKGSRSVLQDPVRPGKKP